MSSPAFWVVTVGYVLLCLVVVCTALGCSLVAWGAALRREPALIVVVCVCDSLLGDVARIEFGECVLERGVAGEGAAPVGVAVDEVSDNAEVVIASALAGEPLGKRGGLWGTARGRFLALGCTYRGGRVARFLGLG